MQDKPAFYLLKLNNRNTISLCEICSKLTIKKLSWRFHCWLWISKCQLRAGVIFLGQNILTRVWQQLQNKSPGFRTVSWFGTTLIIYSDRISQLHSRNTTLWSLLNCFCTQTTKGKNEVEKHKTLKHAFSYSLLNIRFTSEEGDTNFISWPLLTFKISSTSIICVLRIAFVLVWKFGIICRVLFDSFWHPKVLKSEACDHVKINHLYNH